MLQARTDLAQDARETLETIGRNAEMEARPIDDLLDMTRIARGIITLEKRRLDLCAIIKLAVEACRADIEARGREFGLDMGHGGPYGQEEDIQRSHKAGYGAHLTKPATHERLVDCIASVVSAPVNCQLTSVFA
jgi:signal transduction histidine kinase